MHPEFAKAILNFTGAGASLFGVTLADALPDTTKGWFEGGAYVAFVTFLIFAVKYLIAEVKRLQELREADRLKMEGQWHSEHEANRENRERLAAALSDLSTAVKDLRKQGADGSR